MPIPDNHQSNFIKKPWVKPEPITHIADNKTAGKAYYLSFEGFLPDDFTHPPARAAAPS